MKFDSRFTDAFGQVDLVVDNADIAYVAPRMPGRKDRPAAGRAAPILALAAMLIVAALGAGADEPARAQPAAEQAGTENVRGQPTAEQFAPPNQPDVSAGDASTVDALYRLLIGPKPATSRLRTAPNDDAAGSVRRWASPP